MAGAGLSHRRPLGPAEGSSQASGTRQSRPASATAVGPVASLEGSSAMPADAAGMTPPPAGFKTQTSLRLAGSLRAASLKGCSTRTRPSSPPTAEEVAAVQEAAVQATQHPVWPGLSKGAQTWQLQLPEGTPTSTMRTMRPPIGGVCSRLVTGRTATRRSCSSHSRCPLMPLRSRRMSIHRPKFQHVPRRPALFNLAPQLSPR